MAFALPAAIDDYAGAFCHGIDIKSDLGVLDRSRIAPISQRFAWTYFGHIFATFCGHA
jgi:hypothetical protein